MDKSYILRDSVCIRLAYSLLFTHMVSHPDFNHLYEIAENQAGYFTVQQAHSAAVSKERLSYYVTAGRFSRIQRGIYRLVQFPGSPYEDLFVAWLKTGTDSVISHESALYLYKLSDMLPGEVHVIIPRSGSRRREGIRLHTNRLNFDEITWRVGLLATSAARTIIDVTASGTAEEQIRKAVHEAIRQGLTDRNELLSIASRRSSRVMRIIENALDRDQK